MVRYRQAAEAGTGPKGGLRRADREPRGHPNANIARPTAQGGVQASRVEWFHGRRFQTEAEIVAASLAPLQVRKGFNVVRSRRFIA